MLNVSVIGTGSMGRNHIRTYSKLNNANLVAICDIDAEAGKKIAEDYKIKFYKDYIEMMAKEKLDVISIVVPTKLHKEIAIHAIEQGINVLIEKPIANSIAEAQEIFKAAKEHDVKVMVGHLERFNPAVRELKHIIQEGQLGAITSIIAKRVGLFPPRIKDVNVIIDLAIHDIDICNYLLDSKPTKIMAVAGKVHTNNREDYAELFLLYPKSNVFIESNWITPVKIRKLYITGTKGYAELNYITQELDVYEKEVEKNYDDFGDFVIKFGEVKKKTVELKVEEPLLLELQSFLNSVKNGTEPEVNEKEMISVLSIALKCVDLSKKCIRKKR